MVEDTMKSNIQTVRIEFQIMKNDDMKWNSLKYRNKYNITLINLQKLKFFILRQKSDINKKNGFLTSNDIVDKLDGEKMCLKFENAAEKNENDKVMTGLS